MGRRQDARTVARRVAKICAGAAAMGGVLIGLAIADDSVRYVAPGHGPEVSPQGRPDWTWLPFPKRSVTAAATLQAVDGTPVRYSVTYELRLSPGDPVVEPIRAGSVSAEDLGYYIAGGDAEGPVTLEYERGQAEVVVRFAHVDASPGSADLL